MPIYSFMLFVKNSQMIGAVVVGTATKTF